MPARRFVHRTGAFPLGGRVLVMGIVNVTPDSFSDGGLRLHSDDALAAAWTMAQEGADILDIGGESTRPGHVPVDAEAEWRRIAPVFEGLARDGDMTLPVSVDTSKAEVARWAIEAGASIVNDVWGFQRDPEIAAVTAASGAGAILMHNRDAIDPSLDIVTDLLRFLDRSLALARKAGLSQEKLAVDPGIGFGKTEAQNFQALAALPRLKRTFGLPILLGLSRKSFLASLTDPPLAPRDRIAGTLAGNVVGALSGADIIRVHDVAPHVQAVRMIAAIGAAA